MDLTNQLILIGAVFLLGSIVASAVSSRLGAPLLLVFLLIGMLAGEDGPGGIRFHDVQLAHLIGSLALAVILFDGGLRTPRRSFRVGLRPALGLATAGVVGTAVLTGAVATWALGLTWLEGLLLGSIVGSTDAAAVFSILHARGMQIKERVGATLEIESGSNDPMAIFLTIVLVEVLASGRTELDWTVALEFVQQMGLGAVFGVIGGQWLAWLINRLTLESGLYPLLAMAGGLLTFGATAVLGGSGFLAIYLAGLVLGNRQLHSAQNILRVHDGLAWLSQIVMFLVLGLLVTPSALLDQAAGALLVAAALMLVARPLAVWLCLAPFRFPWREQLFIAWVGLRGAVPIILALFPLLAGLPQAQTFFNVAFFVVLVSLLVQGWTVAPFARLLKLEVPARLGPVQRVNIDIPERFDYEFVGYRIAPDSAMAEEGLKRLALPPHSRVTAVVRAGEPLAPERVKKLLPGDYVYLLAPGSAIEELDRIFAAERRVSYLDEHRFFGDFVLNADAKLGDVSTMYGVTVPEEQRGRALAEFLYDVFNRRPVVGDRYRLEGVELVVRELEEGRITKVGLRLVPKDG